MSPSRDVVVIGAGPAGLATARELARCGVDYLVLERGGRLGHTWENLYDSLVLHTGKHLSALPGLPFPRSTPLFPTRLDFVEYLHRYARTFDLSIETGANVCRLTREADLWRITTDRGDDMRARTVVMATGIVANPYEPPIARRNRFRGRVMHSVEYLRPDSFQSRRVLVVGAGNSAGEVAAELSRNGASVAVAVRSGARVVPRELFGVPIQYFAVALSRLPREMQRLITTGVVRASEMVRGPSVLPPSPENRCSDIPLIGFHLVDAAKAGYVRLKGGIAEFTEDGVRFSDGTEEPFDAVILATGYRPALGPLQGLVHVDACGFAHRRGRVSSADQPNLYFVGHNYDTRGGLRNIAQDARLAAKLIAR